jgi:hypothetical protein
MLVYALVSLINLAGLLAFVVGLLFTVPFTSLLLVVTYLSLTRQPVGQARALTDGWDDEPRHRS